MQTIYGEMPIPSYFDWDSRLVRIMGPRSLPEVLHDGKWEKVSDVVKFKQEAYRLTKAEFEKELANRSAP